MKCPKCGQEIPDDSIFCESCGAQVKTIKKKSQSLERGLIIIFAIVIFFLITVLQRERHTIDNALLNLKMAEKKIDSIENIQKEMEEKIQVWKTYISQVPFIITDIEIANVYKNGNIETDYNQTIYSGNTMFLKPKIKYIGLTSGSMKLKLRFYNGDGKMVTGDYDDYSYSDNFYIRSGSNECELIGWGGVNKGYWKKGRCKIEVLYNNTCLGQKSFTIY